MKPQLADSLVTYRLARELDALLSRGVVRRVLPVSKQALALEVSSEAVLLGLLVDWQPGMARAHLVDELKAVGEEAPFVGAVRRLARDAAVLGVRQVGFDRVLALELANLGGLGAEERGTLIVETTGRHVNCLLVRDGQIAAVARPTPQRDGLYRALNAGRPYYPPPGDDKLDPRRASAPDLLAAMGPTGEPLAKALRGAVQGLSNTLLDEVGLRCGLSSEAPVSDLPDGWAEAWLAALREIVEEADRGDAWLYRDDDGLPALVYPIALRQFPDASPERVTDLSEGLALVGRRLAEGEELHRLRGLVVRHFRAEAGRARKVLDERRAELDRARGADQWRVWGELLLANLHALGRVEPGSEVEVTDYYSPDQATVCVPLLPGRGPRQTADVYFRRHKRAQRALSRLPRLLERAQSRLAAFDERLRLAESGADVETLRDLAAEAGIEAAGPSGRRKRDAESRRDAGVRVGRTKAPSGHLVLYGRSATENDTVIRLARPSDLWLHARGVTGAHVLIRTDGAPETVPRATLLWAARLAGKMSDYRPDGVADVDYTLARYVRKPRQSAPGFVTYTHQKTLRVSLEAREHTAEDVQ